MDEMLHAYKAGNTPKPEKLTQCHTILVVVLCFIYDVIHNCT